MFIKVPPGATPIDDISGLIPKHISTKQELDELEFANINQAAQKYFLGQLNDKKAPFEHSWFFKVHKEMYGQVWDWAGKPRTKDLNIGAPPFSIQEQLKQLVDNFSYWENESSMTTLEKAARLHHGLVKIHPFKNGNGRWARFVTNIYLRKKGHALIQWPEETLQVDSPFRKEYIEALKKADRGDFQSVILLHQKLCSP
jgi:Fic-DOC domain mobile mystery protein B